MAEMAIYQHKLAPDFSEGVDRKLLRQVRDRFLKVNHERLDRAMEGLSRRHQDVLRVLPLLYHVNHPLMPGYVSTQAPRGVSDYAPDKTALSIAKSFSQTFKFNKDRRHGADVHSLFMMGSTGTLAHSESSDVDLWLCCAPELDAAQRKELELKAARIDQWANGLGLELHTFIMDAEAFREGRPAPQMDSESSGSAQHVLLLDEFYRTAILLAGRYPLWWLVPPDLEYEYASVTDMLLSKRFVKEKDVIDFGSARVIPKSELVGAGLWQLYKSLDAPYKSVLKLLLAEVYAQEMPASSSLSWEFKQQVYDDQLSANFLDPYLMVYRRLERYLKHRGEMKRLDLVRKSFYLKVNKKLSKRPSGRRPSWQRQLLSEVSGDWGWPESRFKYLDERMNWRVDQVIPERQEVLTELSYVYRFLSSYARANNIGSSITREDLNLLGRKLYATFQRKAGKVERINPGIAPSLWEENLAIHHASSQPFSGDQNTWLLYRDLSAAADASFHPVLKRSTSLIEMLAWLFFNGILTHSTRLSLVPGDSGVTMYEVQQIIVALEQSIPLPLPAVSQQAFLEPAYLKELILFINVGVDPMSTMTERGMHRLSDRTDSLGYSSQRKNLVKTVDQITLNSWNEMSAHRYEMGETLLQTLQAYMQTGIEQAEVEPCRLRVFCYCPQRAEAIAERVRALFANVHDAFFDGEVPANLRYIIEMEERFYLLTRVDQQFRFFVHPDKQALMAALAAPVHFYCPVRIDPYALTNETLLRAVLGHSREHCVQVFQEDSGGNMRFWVVDEFGSVMRLDPSAGNAHQALANLLRFIRGALERRVLSGLSLGAQDLPDIRTYKIKSDARAQTEFIEVHTETEPGVQGILATGFYDGPELRFDLSLNHVEFRYAEHGDQQWAALVHYYHSLPESERSGVPAIVDIAFPASSFEMTQGESTRYGLLDAIAVYQQLSDRLESLLN